MQEKVPDVKSPEKETYIEHPYWLALVNGSVIQSELSDTIFNIMGHSYFVGIVEK